MTQNCENCGKLMKNSDMTHCSDECLLSSLTKSTSVIDNNSNALSWDDRADPWC